MIERSDSSYRGYRMISFGSVVYSSIFGYGKRKNFPQADERVVFHKVENSFGITSRTAGTLAYYVYSIVKMYRQAIHVLPGTVNEHLHSIIPMVEIAQLHSRICRGISNDFHFFQTWLSVNMLSCLCIKICHEHPHFLTMHIETFVACMDKGFVNGFEKFRNCPFHMLGIVFGSPCTRLHWVYAPLYGTRVGMFRSDISFCFLQISVVQRLF